MIPYCPECRTWWTYEGASTDWCPSCFDVAVELWPAP